MSAPEILVAGIGNIFLADDAFGVEVVRLLAARGVDPDVRVVDFGIRGYDLAYALTDGCRAAVLVDCVSRGERPGTLFVIEPEIPKGPVPPEVAADGHTLHPANVLALAATLSDKLPVIRLVGCEPERLVPDDDGNFGMSERVRFAVEPAAGLVERVVRELREMNTEVARHA